MRTLLRIGRAHDHIRGSLPLQEKSHRKRHEPDRNKWFLCVHCRQSVVPFAYGTEHRNHCPECLWSRHLDNSPGDRASGCGGPMEPIGLWVRGDGEWALIHRCRTCGEIHTNRIAGDDNEGALLALAILPLARPAFPLERIRR